VKQSLLYYKNGALKEIKKETQFHGSELVKNPEEYISITINYTSVSEGKMVLKEEETGFLNSVKPATTWYDDNGRKVKSTGLRVLGGNYKYLYEYNKEGYLAKEVYYKEKKLKTTLTYDYDKDKQGNWIKQIEWKEYSKTRRRKIEITYRTITYYD